MIDQALVRELFHYDEGSGVVTWRVSPAHRVKVGDVAGWLGENGYWYVSIRSRKFLLSRVIWLYMTGAWPVSKIDHQDVDSTNNRWPNLREATHSQNEMNKGARGGKRTNKAGVKGVYFHKNRWCAEIRADGKRHYLGRHLTKEAAAGAYRAAAQRLHGQFARI